MKNWFTIKAQAGDAVAEVSIHAEIGMWGINAQQFLRELKNIQAGTINLSINSPGGSVFDALAIFNGLRASGKTINVTVLGIAASAASYLAMAGDKITMPENTFLFIHNPINAVYGNAEDMRDMADVLDKIGASLTATYAKRWKGTDEELTAALAAESYLTAAECLELGLCDEVTPAIEAKAKFDIENLPANIQALFAPAPPAPAALLADEPLAARVTALCAEAGLTEFVAHIVAGVDSEAAAVAAIRDARELHALCAAVDMPDRAAPLIRMRVALPEARKQLADALAEADAASGVNTATPAAAVLTPVKKTGFDVTALWADINKLQRS